MRIDFGRVREFTERVEKESPFDIHPLLPVIDINDNPLSIRIDVPDGEGDEYALWRWMYDARLIRVSNGGKPGFGKSGSRVEGLLRKGHDLFELSRHEESWKRAMERCASAQASTLRALLTELRREASRRVSDLANEKE